MSTLLLLLAIAHLDRPPLTQTPTEWTLDARAHELAVAVPTAKDCAYWGAAEVGKHCEAFLILGSSPKNLKCKAEGPHTDILRCVWDKPKKTKP